MNSSKYARILAISLSSPGFGYAVTEGNVLLEAGHKVYSGDKNEKSFVGIAALINRYRPQTLLLQDIRGDSRRHSRIKKLHQRLVNLAESQKLKVVEISGKRLRTALLGSEKGTKHEIAEHLARRFPSELAARLPTPRKPWASQDARMDIFDAVALAIVYLEKMEIS